MSRILKRPPSITKETLSKELEVLLDMPLSMGGSRVGKAYKTVTAIVKAMTAALKRGETIKIAGFGKFYLHTRPPTHSMASLMYKQTPGPWYLSSVPEKKYINFKPSKVLKRMVNQPQELDNGD